MEEEASRWRLGGPTPSRVNRELDRQEQMIGVVVEQADVAVKGLPGAEVVEVFGSELGVTVWATGDRTAVDQLHTRLSGDADLQTELAAFGVGPTTVTVEFVVVGPGSFP